MVIVLPAPEVKGRVGCQAHRPVAKRSKTCLFLNSHQKTYRQVLRLSVVIPPGCRLLRDYESTSDAAGFVAPECAARPAGSRGLRQPAGREERASSAAPGPVDVLRHHPAASMHAPAAGSSTALPVRTGTLKRSSAYLSSTGQTDNRPPASRNVHGKRFV